ncbi:MAG: DUF1134 domain-containing protein [Hyphomicrobiales bacterium]
MKKQNELIAACAFAGMMLAAAAALAPSAHSESREQPFNERISGPKPNTVNYNSFEDPNAAETYSPQEIVDAGHGFFGATTQGLAKVVEHSFGMAGAPSGYIVGEELAGAFIGGLRYGEGVLHMKDGTREKVYWQGPSFGFDVGGNGSRTMVLVYHLQHPDQVFERYGGIEGSAYFIGGFGVNFQRSTDLLLAPIRTGLGARIGANIGYLKYTREPTWNPF